MFHDCSQKNYLNISLSKTFLNEKLQVKLAGKHLLNRRMILYDGRIITSTSGKMKTRTSDMFL